MHFPLRHSFLQNGQRINDSIFTLGPAPSRTKDTITNLLYGENSLIQHSMGPENNVGLGGYWIMECLLPYLCMVTVPHIMVGLERMLDYRGVGLARFHCMHLTLCRLYTMWAIYVCTARSIIQEVTRQVI